MSHTFQSNHRSAWTAPGEPLDKVFAGKVPRPITVLHVEDCRVNQVQLARQLLAIGEYEFTVLNAEGEDEAMRFFTAVKIGLVILDHYLTQGDGASFLERMRRLDQSVPVIAVSGGRNPQIISALQRLGIDAYVSKLSPIGDLLTHHIRDSLARSEALLNPVAA
jgi:CheY-like chemotaxis protein